MADTFLVAVDREACALYKKELDKLLPPEYSTVVYSPAHNDTPQLAEYHLSEAKEKKIRKLKTAIFLERLFILLCLIIE